MAEETNSGLLDHWQSLERQGKMSRCMDQECAHVWAVLVKALLEEQMKFALNAALDVLPHNSNLHLSQKKNSPACSLCRGNQTLLHVLNNCTTARDHRRYNSRHDLVLHGVAAALSHSYQKQPPCQWTLVRDTSCHAVLCPLTCGLSSCGGTQQQVCVLRRTDRLL